MPTTRAASQPRATLAASGHFAAADATTASDHSSAADSTAAARFSTAHVSAQPDAISTHADTAVQSTRRR